jgi:hypothetical protein
MRGRLGARLGMIVAAAALFCCISTAEAQQGFDLAPPLLGALPPPPPLGTDSDAPGSTAAAWAPGDSDYDENYAEQLATDGAPPPLFAGEPPAGDLVTGGHAAGRRAGC